MLQDWIENFAVAHKIKFVPTLDINPTRAPTSYRRIQEKGKSWRVSKFLQTVATVVLYCAYIWINHSLPVSQSTPTNLTNLMQILEAKEGMISYCSTRWLIWLEHVHLINLPNVSKTHLILTSPSFQNIYIYLMTEGTIIGNTFPLSFSKNEVI